MGHFTKQDKGCQISCYFQKKNNKKMDSMGMSLQTFETYVTQVGFIEVVKIKDRYIIY